MNVAYVVRLFRYSIIYSLLCVVRKVNIETLPQVSWLHKFFVKFAPADVFFAIFTHLFYVVPFGQPVSPNGTSGYENVPPSFDLNFTAGPN